MTFEEYVVNNIERIYEDFEMETSKEYPLVYSRSDNQFMSKLERILNVRKRGYSVVIYEISNHMDIMRITSWIEKHYPKKFHVYESMKNQTLKIVRKSAPKRIDVSTRHMRSNWGKTDCEICGAEFNKKNPEHKVCSSQKCKLIAKRKWKDSRRSNIQSMTRLVICDICGKRFKVKGRRTKRRCSDECTKIAKKLDQRHRGKYINARSRIKRKKNRRRQRRWE